MQFFKNCTSPRAVLIFISKMAYDVFECNFLKIALTTGLNCTHNRPKLHSASPRAITCLLPCKFFPNSTQTHVVTYKNCAHLYHAQHWLYGSDVLAHLNEEGGYISEKKSPNFRDFLCKLWLKVLNRVSFSL